jgi:hypothetical protein
MTAPVELVRCDACGYIAVHGSPNPDDPTGANWNLATCERCRTGRMRRDGTNVTDACAHLVKGGGLCELNAGHRGYHSTVTFACDGCGKRRRGRPHRYARDGEYERGLAFCFLCVLAAE